jgi:Domain of unknown function (DUF4390)
MGLFATPSGLTMKPSLTRKACALILAILLVMQNPAHAQDARLTDIIVTNTRDDLLVYLTVEGAFREKTKNAILSGVPTTFSFFISLYQERNLWFDKEVADIKITHTLKYNNLKKEFIVKRSWENDDPLVTQSFDEARKLMTEIDSLKIVPLRVLEKGRRYQIRAKAELSKLTLPYYLHYVLFFVSLWDFETDLYTIDFVY